MKKFDHLKGKHAAAFNDVPEGYFERMKQEVGQQIELSQKRENPARSRRIMLAAAAVVVLFLASAVLLILTIDPPQNKLADNKRVYSPIGEETLVKQNSNKLDNKIIEANLQWQASADTLSWDDISTEDLILYLLELEEFEF
jgi:hypothetical protein